MSGVKIALSGALRGEWWSINIVTMPKFDPRIDEEVSGRPADRRRRSAGFGGFEPCSCAQERWGTAIEVYNEEAFGYFLDLEYKRAEALNRSFVLMLLTVKSSPDTAAEIDAATSSSIFAALATCLRETDFIGWYRANSVIGAVLTEGPACATVEPPQPMPIRVSDVIHRALPELAPRLELSVRTYRPGV